MSRLIRGCLALIVVALIVGVVAFAALFVVSGGDPFTYARTALIRLSLMGRAADLERSVSADDTPIRFAIAAGDAPRTIANNLLRQDLIIDADLFVDYVRVNGVDARLQAGTYFLMRSMTIPEIAQALTDPRSTQFPFRILEGWRLEEIAAAIDANRYFGFDGAAFMSVVGAGAAAAVPDFAERYGIPLSASLEGFMFPDTYTLPAVVTPEMLRQMLTETFAAKVDERLRLDAAAQGLSLFEVVTLASIVQREAVHADEQPKIAGVYRNRLAIGMKLDADPTVQYGLGFRGGRWWAAITRADYSGVISPYNTYLNTGLPPGPIASPGLSAIRAVVYPESSDYFYFRARCSGDGYHNFARTFEEHLANGC